MTKRLKVYLLIILATVCAACTIAGCTIGRPGRDELLAGYNISVVYYANGGLFDGSNSINVRELYIKNDPSSENYNENGVPFFDVNSKDTSLKVARSGWDLKGWYYPARHVGGIHDNEIQYTYTYRTESGESKTEFVYPVIENGEQVKDKSAARPVFAREGVDEQILEKEVLVVPSDRRITGQDLVKGFNFIVCADWQPSLKIEFRLACDAGTTYHDAEGNAYTHGSLLREQDFGEGSICSPSTLTPILFTDATFLKTFANEEGTENTSPIERPADNKNPVVWSRFIDGAGWTIVDSAKSVVSIFNGLTSEKNKFYLYAEDDPKEIDCSSVTLSLKANAINSRATIEGNGVTLKGLKFVTQSAAAGSNLSIFGTLANSFKVHNLKISDITITASGRGDLYMYAFWSGVSADIAAADLDIEVGSVTANVSVPAGNNFWNAQDGDRTNWLFGGETSDAAFLAKYTNVKITGETSLNPPKSDTN